MKNNGYVKHPKIDNVYKIEKLAFELAMIV